MLCLLTGILALVGILNTGCKANADLYVFAAVSICSAARDLKQFPTVYIDSPKTLPTIAAPTGKFAYKDGVGAFQGWNGGLELPKTIDLGGVRVTRPILRG